VWRGTGFLVESDCTFMTAKHVIADVNNSQLWVRYEMPPARKQSVTLRVNVAASHKNLDLALLRTVDPESCSHLHRFEIEAGELGSDSVGEAVLVPGHPTLGEDSVDTPVLKRGYISAAEMEWLRGERMLLLDLVGVPGMSGSPVIREATGRVVGVVFGSGWTTPAEGFEWATPVSRPVYETLKP
jgi:hypothetical protein